MTGTPENPDVDLGWRSQAILAAIHEHGGTANTREIRDATGIEDGTKVPYRMKNKLPTAGLVEIERPGLDDRGRTLPMEATLTEAGERLAERIAEAEDDDQLANVSDYTERLEAKVNQLETRLDELEDNGSRTDERDAFAETVEQFTASKFGAWDEEGTQQFTELLVGMLALRNYLLEESDLTRDELDERKAQAQTALED